MSKQNFIIVCSFFLTACASSGRENVSIVSVVPKDCNLISKFDFKVFEGKEERKMKKLAHNLGGNTIYLKDGLVEIIIVADDKPRRTQLNPKGIIYKCR